MNLLIVLNENKIMSKNKFVSLLVIIFQLIFSKILAQCPNSVILGSASNMFGVIINETTPIAIDNNINTIAFVHRNSVAQFSLNTGHLRYDVSFNAGQTWTSNIGVLNPALTYGARYPNALLYNPTNNTLAVNAHVGYFCAALNSGGTWGYIVSGKRQLNGSGNTENYNQPGINNYLIPQSVVKSSQGVYWGLDYASNGSNSLTGSLYVFKGIWNNNLNDVQWTLNNTITNAVNTGAWGYPSIGFDPTGQIGYIVLTTDPNSNGYYSPVVYKTTNSGQTWTGPTTINLNQFSCLTTNMGGANVAVDNSNCIVVDANGSAHIICVVGKQSGYSVDATSWHHIVDLTNLNDVWTIRDIGNLQTGKNTFVGSLNSQVIQAWSPQCARTSDGTKVFFTWVDNINSSLGSVNNTPNLYGRGFDVTSGNWTQVKDFSSCGTNTSGKIYFPHIAREVFVNNSTYKIAPVYGEFTTTGNDIDITTNYRYLDNCLFSVSEFTTATPSLTLSLNPYPNIVLCQGSQAQVQLLGNYSQILWSNNATTSITSVSSTGILTVTARQGCTLGTQTLSVQQLSYTASSSSVLICSGSAVTLNAIGNAQSYTWNPGSINSSSAIVSPTVTSTYTINAGGTSCSSSSAITVSVNPLPIVTIISNYTRTCAGSSATLQASGANLYSWSNGSTGPSTTINPTMNTTYSLTAVNALGCVATFTYNQVVDPIPSLTVNTTSNRICLGETATLSVNGAFSYFWNTGSTSSLVVVNPNVSTTYTVVGTNTLMCSASYTLEQKVDACTQVPKEFKINSMIKIFPNPLTNYVNLIFPYDGELRIYDIYGRVLQNEFLLGSKMHQIELLGYSDGVYYFECTGAWGTYTRKMIISK